MQLDQKNILKQIFHSNSSHIQIVLSQAENIKIEPKVLDLCQSGITTRSKDISAKEAAQNLFHVLFNGKKSYSELFELHKNEVFLLECSGEQFCLKMINRFHLLRQNLKYFDAYFFEPILSKS